ncbi:hypothetical protein [Aurantiacibacter sp. D1-12]|uniref:hypothetical protein n=1 Tax=Aurantiacibacter sp. D1-12 TaxID=2993658 RepID=UPI00237D1578|nr:hypothetical protein [Aurantiacibacter sp. D1-12]MDE1468236.1 hypothetical protein [Aurantiacibacter sp. D1-12]
MSSAWAVLAVWLLYCAVRLAIQPWIGWQPVGPDDWTRLLEVRDLLSGQSWWDITQYRMNPPDGFSMQWSRLVDMPLALAITVFGERWGMALVPLFWLLPALFALRAIMLRLGFNGGALLAGLVLLPLFPLLPGNFAPMRIDHHAPQAVLALATAALMLSTRRRGAVGAGLMASAWLVISLEALPLVAVIAGLYGLRYLADERPLLPWFLLSLTLFSLFLSLATRPNIELLGPYCDVLRPGHVAAFGVATLIAGIMPFLPFQHVSSGRLAGLALIPIATIPLALVLLGECATNPMAQLDPVLATWWHGYITEGLPFWKQPVSVAAMLIWTLVPLVLGYWLAGKGGAFADGAGVAWLMLFLLALAAWGYSLFLMRAAVIGQLLTIPFAAVLLALLLPQARAIPSMVPRLLATLGCIFLATPMFMSAITKPLDPMFPTQTMARGAAAPVVAGSCDYASLAALEPGLMLVTMDAGPAILGQTQHSIVAASYHRNQQPMVDVVSAFTGPPGEAQAVLRGYDADYVIACLSASDLALYRTADEANFANALANGEVPQWLTPVVGFDSGVLRVYRVN